MQILGVTLDNASNNNTLVSELANLIDGFQGKQTCICCFAHILNLVVKVQSFCWTQVRSNSKRQAILPQFSKSNKAMEDPQDDEDDDAALSGLQEVDDDEEVEPYFDGGDGYNAD